MITIILLISKVRVSVHDIHQNRVNAILQVPTWLAFANSLRQAGGSFAGLNIGSRDLGGATGTMLINICA